MSFSIYDSSVPVFVNSLTNMRAWLDKAAAERTEADLLEARLAPDMRPLTGSISNGVGHGEERDRAAERDRGAVDGRHGGQLRRIARPLRPDDRLCQKRRSVDFGGKRGTRRSCSKFPNGSGYSFKGGDYLTRFALPNFFFHVTAAYAILRAAGVSAGQARFPAAPRGQPSS